MDNAEKKQKAIGATHSLSSYAMGTDGVNIVCTYGKISIWYGRQTPAVIVGQTLISISKIDKTAVHETELVCDFDKITEYESSGYILVSYAKAQNGYRAMFNIPFYSDKALYHLAESIIEDLKKDDVHLDIYWNGDDSDITRLSEEFKNIEGWKVKDITYKDEGKHRDAQKI